MSTPIVRIDAEHTVKLLRGKPVTIKVPGTATTVKLQLTPPPSSSSELVKLFDVFFNGRPA